MKKLILGAVLGGLTLHIWGVISYMVLPWHNWHLLKFSNEAAVESVIQANVPGNGIYILPNFPQGTDGLSKEEKKELMKQGMEKQEAGPFIFASIRKNGVRPMGTSIALALLGYIGAAGLATWLLLQTTIQTFVKKVWFIKSIALASVLIIVLPNWIWWGFSNGFTLVQFLDIMVGWGLAGAVIAKVTTEKSRDTPEA